MKVFRRDTRAYRAFNSAYAREIGSHTYLSLPNAIQRHRNRHIKRYLPRLRIRMLHR